MQLSKKMCMRFCAPAAELSDVKSITAFPHHKSGAIGCGCSVLSNECLLLRRVIRKRKPRTANIVQMQLKILLEYFSIFHSDF